MRSRPPLTRLAHLIALVISTTVCVSVSSAQVYFYRGGVNRGFGGAPTTFYQPSQTFFASGYSNAVAPTRIYSYSGLSGGATSYFAVPVIPNVVYAGTGNMVNPVFTGSRAAYSGAATGYYSGRYTSTDYVAPFFYPPGTYYPEVGNPNYAVTQPATVGGVAPTGMFTQGRVDDTVYTIRGGTAPAFQYTQTLAQTPEYYAAPVASPTIIAPGPCCLPR